MEGMPESRKAYVKALEELGFDEIHVARNFAEAYQRLALERAPYDLIVLDEAFWKDKHLGLKLCRIVRSDESYEHTALLMISEDCSSLLIEEAFRAGVDEFLPKYTSLREFKKLSQDALLERKCATLAL